MVDLIHFKANLCATAVGFCVHEQKMLLAHHKKLGIWLAPGGHIDENELPHLAAEREVLEETGLQVIAYDLNEAIPSTFTEYVPNPVFTNLHWISQENYQERLKNDSGNTSGCEQHFVFAYLVKLVGDNITPKIQEREINEVRWFDKGEIESLDTIADIKEEIYYIFRMVSDGN